MTEAERTTFPEERVAWLVTELCAPIVMIILVTSVVAVHSSPSFWRGALLAGVLIFFAGAVPYAILLAGVRRGRLGDRNLVRREERPQMMVVALVSVGFGLLTMRALHAPTELYALVVAMTAGVAVALLISTFWKISIHTACVAGTVTVLVLLVSPWLAVLTPAVIVTAWARLVLRHHTLAQVLAGALVGGGVATAALVPFLR